MANKLQPNSCVTGKVRLSYVYLNKPKKNEAGEDVWACQLLIPKTDKETLDKIKACIAAVKTNANAINKWGGKVPGELKLPLRDGDATADEFPERKGCWFTNCNAWQRVPVFNRDREEIMDPTEIYSGMYARVSLDFYAFNNSGNKGIAVALVGVQKLADGEALGGVRRDPGNDFEDDYDDDDFLG